MSFRCNCEPRSTILYPLSGWLRLLGCDCPENLIGRRTGYQRLHCGCWTRRKGWGSPQGEPAALLQNWSLAQLVEQQSPKLPAGGSSPSRSATLCEREGGFLRKPHKLFNHGSSPCLATIPSQQWDESGWSWAVALCRCLIPASAQPPRKLGDGLRLHAGSRPECGYTVSPATFS